MSHEYKINGVVFLNLNIINYTRLVIAYVVRRLSIYTHVILIKVIFIVLRHLLRYLKVTIDFGLHFNNCLPY